MTTLAPELLRLKVLRARLKERILKKVLGSRKVVDEFLNQCFYEDECSRELGLMDDEIFKLIIQGCEVVQ